MKLAKNEANTKQYQVRMFKHNHKKETEICLSVTYDHGLNEDSWQWKWSWKWKIDHTDTTQIDVGLDMDTNVIV